MAKLSRNKSENKSRSPGATTLGASSVPGSARRPAFPPHNTLPNHHHDIYAQLPLQPGYK